MHGFQFSLLSFWSGLADPPLQCALFSAHIQAETLGWVQMTLDWTHGLDCGLGIGPLPWPPLVFIMTSKYPAALPRWEPEKKACEPETVNIVAAVGFP
jgi:hypothetical protein